MCGIVGTVRFGEPLDRHLLIRQRDALAHRGPDASGLWISRDDRIGLAHRRLAILDLTAGGNQPMVDPVTGSIITFNGEIYNYRALRQALLARGHRATTHSDTEVILLAYREWGLACLDRLEGMFAFGLYDTQARRMVLARDRAGEKPLFYWHTDAQFSFASEIKALHADPACPRRLSPDGLNAYLAYGYTTGDRTLWADVRQVAPGGWITIACDSAAVSHGRYWTPPQAERQAHPYDRVDLDALATELDGLLEEAVQRQLVADVPTGVLLSGGLDSSLITAMAARVSDQPVRTFTVRFPESPAIDEGPFARLVASHFGTQHTELDAEPATADLLRTLAHQYDNPIADSSMLPTYLVSRAIRREATVALGGDGGDELFGGYHRYPALLTQDMWRNRLPAPVRRLFARGLLALWPSTARGHGWLEAMAGSTSSGLAAAGRLLRPGDRAALMPMLGTLGPERLLAPEMLRGNLTQDRSGVVNQATTLDFSTYLPEDILVKGDRASMLASLELRAPFLDAQLLDFAFTRVPDTAKATRGIRKRLLRHLGHRLLPSALDMDRKQGFSIPLSTWLRGPWRPLLEDVRRPLVGALINPRRYQQLVARLDAGADVGTPLFALLMLSLWADAYQITDVAG